MTCRDAEQLLGHFVDAELPPPMLLAVARHAADCRACEEAARRLTSLHEAIASTVEDDVGALDLSGVWPAVEHRIARTPRRPPWRERLGSAPLWGGMLAAAASALFFLQTRPMLMQARHEPARQVAQVRRPRDQAFIDRLDARNHKVAVRSVPKSGTTLIWVDYDPMEAPN
jgi:hypothetical protein